MNTYGFILILNGVSEITSEIEDALFESGCDDACLGQREGVISLEFMRESNSFEDALFSAIEDIYNSDSPATVSHVGEYDVVTIPLIMERAGINKQRLHQYINGDRGPGNFPPPLYTAGKSKFFSWIEVADWLNTNTDIEVDVNSDIDIIEAVNGMLKVKKHIKTMVGLKELWDRMKAVKV